ncbi:MAG: SAM-dependent methyltransferase [Nitrososphaera sp.]
MDIDEFVSSLPKDVVSGDKVLLSKHVLQRILKFAGLKRTDVFYHLGCGTGEAVAMAALEFKVRKSIGVELNKEFAEVAARNISKIKRAEIRQTDVLDADISDATVILFWFSEPEVVRKMEKKFRRDLRDGARVITVWSPLGMNLPDKVEFPFFVCKKPFHKARSIRDQIEAIYGNRCIDFTAAWLLAERYIDQLGSVQAEYRRFLNMIQSMVIWINAWNMGVACEKEIPPPVETYIGILKTFFEIDMSGMIMQPEKSIKRD